MHRDYYDRDWDYYDRDRDYHDRDRDYHDRDRDRDRDGRRPRFCFPEPGHREADAREGDAFRPVEPNDARTGYRTDRRGESRDGEEKGKGSGKDPQKEFQNRRFYRDFFSQAPMMYAGEDGSLPPLVKKADKNKPSDDPAGFGRVTLRDGRMEDRTRDWVCKCGERNFLKRQDCWKCFAKKPIDQKGPDTQAEWDDLCKNLKGTKWRSRSRSHRRKKKKKGKSKKRRKSSSSSESSSSGRSTRRKKSRSVSRHSISSSGEPKEKASESPGRELRDISDMEREITRKKTNPEIEAAKSNALQKLVKLKAEAPENRKRQWRALLREWHPDKHENKELATAVFQFLQKGKSLVIDEAL